jgi:hypothetical protein
LAAGIKAPEPLAKNRNDSTFTRERIMEFTLGDLMGLETAPRREPNRRHFIGGSDARIIMSPNEAALIRLWKGRRSRTRRPVGQSRRASRRRLARHSTGLGGPLFRSIPSLSLFAQTHSVSGEKIDAGGLERASPYSLDRRERTPLYPPQRSRKRPYTFRHR